MFLRGLFVLKIDILKDHRNKIDKDKNKTDLEFYNFIIAKKRYYIIFKLYNLTKENEGKRREKLSN